MNSLKKWLLMPFIPVLFLIAGCKDKPAESDRCDRKTMLENYMNNLIVPGFKQTQTQVGALKTTWQHFISNPGESILNTLRQDWTAACQSWQLVSVFNFGPAGNSGLKLTLREEIGFYP